MNRYKTGFIRSKKWLDMRLLIVLIVALITTLAVACAGDDEAGGQPQQPAPAAQAVQAQLGQAAQPAAPAAKATEAEPAPTTAPAMAVAKPRPAPVAKDEGVRRGGHLKVGAGQRFPAKWDLTQGSAWHFTMHFRRHYSGILQLSPRDGQTVIPDLAESWEFNQSSDVLTVNLREGVQWHDGEPFTVEDVQFSLDRWVNPPTGIAQPRVSGFLNITGTEKLDEQTLNISLEGPNVDFLLDLADAWHIMVPEHIVQMEGGINSSERLIGTGPFVLKDAERDSFDTSEANPNYFLTAPDGNPYAYLYLVTVHQFTDWATSVAAFRTHLVDFVNPLVDLDKGFGTKRDEGDLVEFEAWFPPGVSFIALNGQKSPFNDFRARKALHLALDRTQLVEQQKIPGQPPQHFEVSFLGDTDPNLRDLFTYPGYNPDTRDEDVAEAKRLFQEVGLTEFDLLTPSFTTYINLTNLIAQQMEDIGIKVNITSQDVAAARAKATEGDYEAMVEGISNAVASTLTSINLAYVPGGGTYYHSAPPPEKWLGLLTDARVTPPGAERNAIFKEMDTIMREEWVPKIPTIRQNLYTLRWAYVHNYDPIPGAMFTATVFFDVWLDQDAPAR